MTLLVPSGGGEPGVLRYDLGFGPEALIDGILISGVRFERCFQELFAAGVSRDGREYA